MTAPLDKLKLDHPCKESCSGWKQGYDKGFEARDAEVEKLTSALRLCKNEMKYRIYQIEGGYDIPLTGEMHAAVKIAEMALGTEEAKRE